MKRSTASVDLLSRQLRFIKTLGFPTLTEMIKETYTFILSI